MDPFPPSSLDDGCVVDEGTDEAMLELFQTLDDTKWLNTEFISSSEDHSNPFLVATSEPALLDPSALVGGVSEAPVIFPQPPPLLPSTEAAGNSSSSSSPGEVDAQEEGPMAMVTTIVGEYPLDRPIPTIALQLYHKPRGFGGKWINVEDGDRIRVAGKVGKKLRIQALCNFAFRWDEMHITLWDLNLMRECSDALEISQSKVTISDGSADVHVTIKGKCERYCFHVLIKSRFGFSCSGKTVEFSAHNDGKSRKKTKPNDSEGSSAPISPVSMYSDSATSSPGTPPTTELSPPTAKRKRVDLQPQSIAAHSPPMLASNIGGAPDSSVELSPTPSLFGAPNLVKGDLHVSGTVKATAFMQYSDVRLKTGIEDLVNAMDIVMRLQGKTYYWKKDAPPSASTCIADGDGSADASPSRTMEEAKNDRVLGLIAQEVQRVVPEVVKEDPVTGYLAVSYSELVPVLIEALKQHLGDYQRDQRNVENQLELLRADLDNLMLSEKSYATSLTSKSTRGKEKDDDDDDGGGEDEIDPSLSAIALGGEEHKERVVHVDEEDDGWVLVHNDPSTHDARTSNASYGMSEREKLMDLIGKLTNQGTQPLIPQDQAFLSSAAQSLGLVLGCSDGLAPRLVAPHPDAGGPCAGQRLGAAHAHCDLCGSSDHGYLSCPTYISVDKRTIKAIRARNKKQQKVHRKWQQREHRDAKKRQEKQARLLSNSRDASHNSLAAHGVRPPAMIRAPMAVWQSDGDALGRPPRARQHHLNQMNRLIRKVSEKHHGVGIIVVLAWRTRKGRRALPLELDLCVFKPKLRCFMVRETHKTRAYIVCCIRRSDGAADGSSLEGAYALSATLDAPMNAGQVLREAEALVAVYDIRAGNGGEDALRHRVPQHVMGALHAHSASMVSTSAVGKTWLIGCFRVAAGCSTRWTQMPNAVVAVAPPARSIIKPVGPPPTEDQHQHAWSPSRVHLRIPSSGVGGDESDARYEYLAAVGRASDGRGARDDSSPSRTIDAESSIEHVVAMVKRCGHEVCESVSRTVWELELDGWATLRSGRTLQHLSLAHANSTSVGLSLHWGTDPLEHWVVHPVRAKHHTQGADGPPMVVLQSRISNLFVRVDPDGRGGACGGARRLVCDAEEREEAQVWEMVSAPSRRTMAQRRLDERWGKIRGAPLLDIIEAAHKDGAHKQVGE